MNDDLTGVRGKETSGPRWEAFRERNNTAARLASEGRNAEAAAMLNEAVALTRVPDVDAAGLDGRARALANLAAIAEGQGEPDESLRLAAEALAACATVLAEVGDRYGTAAVQASVLLNRAQTHQLVGRLDDALADLDAALPIIEAGDGDDEAYLAVALHNSRSVLLIGLERWEDAEAAARRSLELAAARDPRLTGHPYSNLAVIAQSLGDFDAALTYLDLAQQIHTTAGDATAAALALANRGRIATRNGDFETGRRLLAEAERALDAAEQPLRAAELRYSRAHAALQAGDLASARELIDPAVAVLRGGGHATMLAEALALRGDLEAAEGDFDAAERTYLEAWRAYEAAGARYHLARTDMRRAFAVAARLGCPGVDQVALLRHAFDLALPAALATDAIRHGFAPGRARERWAAQVAIPAMAHALSLAAALRDGALVSELLEHMSATVSLHAAASADPLGAEPTADPFGPDPLTALAGGPAPEPLARPSADRSPGLGETALPYTASGLLTGTSSDFPVARFALPPRLRVNPYRPSQLEPWIRETERRYGFPIRSDEVIDAW